VRMDGTRGIFKACRRRARTFKECLIDDREAPANNSRS
jgi:hypothetical protein